MMTRMQAANDPSMSGGRLVSADGRTLPLRGATLSADAKGGVARVVLAQRFVNVHAEPLHVTYLMPLPAEGAVSGYAFTIGNRRITGEVDRKQAARERFERALAEGRSAGIVDQERSSLFTQELGNIPPGAEVIAELTVDQRLTWLEEGAWEWRFPTAVGPRYQGAEGRVPDAKKIEVAVADGPLPVTLSLGLMIRDALTDGQRPDSPAHALSVQRGLDGCRVELAGEGVRLDRDVVVRWPAATPKVGLGISLGRPPHGRATSDAAFALITLVPPVQGSIAARRRDLILLLDTSGSMGGAPLDQSKKVCAALIDSLGEDDRLEMIEFSNSARRWRRGAVNAGPREIKDAHKWLQRLEASGGTEMVSGVMEALSPLDAEAQRQVVLLTDGYIGFETEVVKAICDKLPQGSRLHVVGVGSAVNRSLTAPTARAGRGIEVVIGISEDPERAAMRLVARTAAPILTDVELEGDALIACAPLRLPDLYGGCPALAAAKLSPRGGSLRVRGRTAHGEWSETVRVPACEPGEGSQAAAALFARETVEDLELKKAAGKGDVEEQIEQLGLAFQISTRLTTWVAIAQEIGVDPASPTRREIVPQELPHGVSAEGLGLRGATMMAPPVGAAMGAMATRGGAPMKSMVAPSPMQRRKESVDKRDSGADDELESPMPADKPAAPAELKREGARAARRLRARVRLAKDGRIVLEIIADGELDWSPPAEVLVELSDGTRTMATVVTAQTTRAGRIGAGQSLRLVLELDEEPARVMFGDVELEIE